ncbi:MAG: endonuclease III domain-containing protein [Candidatus Kryptoniota bacterium]
MPDPLDLLIATILSQNTNDVNSHRAFSNLKSAFPDLRTLANVRPGKIEPLIKVGGIANRKSKVIIQVIKEIREKYTRFDRRSLRKFEREELIEQLRSLNGVGYKTASCVVLFSLGGDDAFPVDTHIHRILNRLGVINEKTPDKTYLAVRNHVPRGRGYELHLNLIKFGRKTCTARKPRCYECGLFDICRWKEKTSQHLEMKKKSGKREVEFMLLESV